MSDGLIKTIDFTIIGDERGSLVALEQNKNIPFEIKRVYYIFDTKKGISRGFHSHRNLQQVVIAVSGSCNFILDDGKDKREVLLNNPKKGLFIGNNIWREMYSFSADCVLMVIASEHYDEEDYIRSYNEFVRGVK